MPLPVFLIPGIELTAALIGLYAVNKSLKKPRRRRSRRRRR